LCVTCVHAEIKKSKNKNSALLKKKKNCTGPIIKTPKKIF